MGNMKWENLCCKVALLYVCVESGYFLETEISFAQGSKAEKLRIMPFGENGD